MTCALAASSARHSYSHPPPSSSTMIGGPDCSFWAYNTLAAFALFGLTTACFATVAATFRRLLLSPFCSIVCV